MRDKEGIDTDRFAGLTSDQKIDLVYALLKELVAKDQLQDIEKASQGEVRLPVYIFQNDVLSCLEAIVKYLHENLDFGFTKIGKILNRSSKTIWATYAKAHRKMPAKFVPKASPFSIPVSVFQERTTSVLESIVEYLHDIHKLSYKDISVLVNRDNRTIWTVYHRAKKKRSAP